MNSGWFLVHHKIIDSSAWNSLTAAGKVVMFVILDGCSYRETKVMIDGKERILKPGQWLTSLKKIQERAGKDVSIQNIRTAVAILGKCDFLTNEVTKGNQRIITVRKWNQYQRPTEGLTDDQQTPNSIQINKTIKRRKEYSSVHNTKNNTKNNTESNHPMGAARAALLLKQEAEAATEGQGGTND